jgi:hypothetical protein
MTAALRYSRKPAVWSSQIAIQVQFAFHLRFDRRRPFLTFFPSMFPTRWALWTRGNPLTVRFRYELSDFVTRPRLTNGT